MTYEFIHDPVEDTPEYQTIVAAVDKKAGDAVEAIIKNLIAEQGDEEFIRSLPTAPIFAAEKKRILLEEYGIGWKSYMELNPKTIFD